MADPISYVEPLVAPNVATLLATLTLWFWPVLVTGVGAIIYWKTLRHRVAFLVLGYLMCIGVGALARSTGAYIFWTFITDSTPNERLVVTYINQSLSATLAGVVFSILPIIWLARILRRNDAAI
jgi:hypothetical protein